MREDMPKVVVERERLYGNTGYHHYRASRKHNISEEAPYGEGIRRPYDWDRKSLNENLSPLRGFLRSRVGKPWDKVYSEISENLKPSSAVQQHVRDHVKTYVTLELIVKSDGYYSRGTRNWEQRLYKGSMYVDKNGILRVLKRDLPPKAKGAMATQHFLITSLTERTEKRRHVSKYKTTYYLHAKKSYQPMSGEVIEETIEASSYESALEYFKKGYEPIKTFEKDHFGCNCLDCCALRAQPLALLAS